jgi:alpha-L-fucosidase 2
MVFGGLLVNVLAAVPLSVDWASFLDRSDPTWSQVPQTWYESGFVGNGKLGAMVRVDTDGETLKLDIGNSGVWDDRMPGEPYSFVPDDMSCNRPRLPIGAFVLNNFAIMNATFQMKLRLHDAEVAGRADDIDAADGTLGWRVFAHAVYDEADVIVVEITHNTTGATQKNPTWLFEPEDANRPWTSRGCKGYNFTNPPVRNSTVQPDGAQLFTQDHLSGSEHTTAVLALPGHTTTAGALTSTTSVMYVSTSSVLPKGEGDAAALGAVRAAAKAGLAALTASHRAWWHAYYPAGGFVTLADPKTEGFYWTQMYKIASATRADRELYDLMGPWGVHTTSWPDVHWDLNLQLTYWVFFTSNRVDLARSLTSRLGANTPTLINNVPPAWRVDSAAGPSDSSSPLMQQSCGAIGGLQFNGTCLTAAGTKPTAVGNLLWTLQQWHNLYRYNGFDDAELSSLFPLFARAVTYYSHITHNVSDVLHINATVSPEYGSAPDVNYDVALLRWGLAAVIDAADTAKLPAAVADARLPMWRDMAARLTPYPTDEATGFLVGDGMPLEHGHRHFSHLLMLFPLKLLDLTDAAQKAVAEKSLDHWIGEGNLHGFSYTGISPMNVMLGRRAEAFTNMTLLFDKYIEANTMYFEGKEYPCGETPPAAASAIMDWLLMEWQGIVRVFPGIDDASLADAAFDRLLAPGGFEVSARRAAAATAFVSVTNAHGVAAKDMATLSLLVDAMPLPWGVEPATVKFAARTDGSGVVDVDLSTLPKNATVTFYSAAAKPASFEITASTGGDHGEYNYWGLPKGGPPAPAPPTPPPVQVCTTGTVCATKFAGNGQGCCPYENAVCCTNAMTCCPGGSTCKVYGWQSTCVGAPPATATGQPICKTGAPLPFSKTLPNVLIIGDSVSIGYTPKVAAHMAPVAFVQHSPWDIRDGGAEETAYGVTCLKYMLQSPYGGELEPDVIMFNWGLHDGPLKNVTEPGQYGLPAVYASELENITAQLQAARPKAKLLFALTTPYMCTAAQDGCVVNLNNQATAIMKKYGIPTINLHDVITGECGQAPNSTCFGQHQCFCPHCSGANGIGYEFIATRSIVPAITALLPNPTTPTPGPRTPTPPPPAPTPAPPSGHPCLSYGATPPPGYDCNTGACMGADGHCGTEIAEPLLDLSGGCSFAQPTEMSLAACAEAAAAACDAEQGCGSFALDPQWKSYTPKAKLFAKGSATTPNAGWNAWVKK